jgi:hypothetical protein
MSVVIRPAVQRVLRCWLRSHRSEELFKRVETKLNPASPVVRVFSNFGIRASHFRVVKCHVFTGSIFSASLTVGDVADFAKAWRTHFYSLSASRSSATVHNRTLVEFYVLIALQAAKPPIGSPVTFSSRFQGNKKSESLADHFGLHVWARSGGVRSAVKMIGGHPPLSTCLLLKILLLLIFANENRSHRAPLVSSIRCYNCSARFKTALFGQNS